MDPTSAIRPRPPNLVALQSRPGSVGENLVTHMRRGRYAVSTVGNDPNVQLMGTDPYGSSSYTGLWVPTAPTTVAKNRYLFQLVRAGFHNTERVRIVGLKLYASIRVRIDTVSGAAPTFFELPITSPLWRFPNGGNISWHVRLLPKGWRDTRSTTDADSLCYVDSKSSALLYQTLGPYTPPNGGRPYGSAIPYGDLGNFHDLRYPWRDSQSELELDIPIPPAHDVAVYASVWQHDPNAALATLDASHVAVLGPEDRFAYLFAGVNLGAGLGCQYGRVAAQIVFEEEIAK